MSGHLKIHELQGHRILFRGISPGIQWKPIKVSCSPDLRSGGKKGAVRGRVQKKEKLLWEEQEPQ
jgi:hypothetical protein